MHRETEKLRLEKAGKTNALLHARQNEFALTALRKEAARGLIRPDGKVQDRRKCAGGQEGD